MTGDHPPLDEEVLIASYTQRQSYHLAAADGTPRCNNIESWTAMPLRRALRCASIGPPAESMCMMCAANSPEYDQEWDAVSHDGETLSTITCPNCGEGDIAANQFHTHITHHCEATPEPADDDQTDHRRWV